MTFHKSTTCVRARRIHSPRDQGTICTINHFSVWENILQSLVFQALSVKIQISTIPTFSFLRRSTPISTTFVLNPEHSQQSQ